MSVAEIPTTASLRGEVSEAEWQSRVDLAACYRLVAHHGMTDLTATHISARVPGQDGAFLINPYDMFFDEITASSLVKVDITGQKMAESPHSVNRRGFQIHGAVHGVRPDIQCVLHTHTRTGMAVSAMECGLLPMSQHALVFHGRVGYHDYEGPDFNAQEQGRMVRHLGPHCAMILHNHGLLIVGRNIAEAWFLTYYLEKACQSQVDLMTAGAEIKLPPEEIRALTAERFRGFGPLGQRSWPGHLRQVERLDPGFRD